MLAIGKSGQRREIRQAAVAAGAHFGTASMGDGFGHGRMIGGIPIRWIIAIPDLGQGQSYVAAGHALGFAIVRGGSGRGCARGIGGATG